MQIAVIPPGSDDQQFRPLTKDEGFDLSDDFAALYSNVVPLLAGAVSVDKLNRYLKAFCHHSTNLPYIKPSLYQHLTSVEEVLDVLLDERYFHPTQINLLQKIVKSHGCPECKRLLQAYEDGIPKSTPLKRSSNELTDEEIESSSGTKRLKVEVTGDSNTYCLEDVQKVQQALEESTGIDHVVIVYAKSEPGSVVLTFIVPACTVESFTNISKSKKRLSALAAIGILSIEVDNVTIDVKAHLVLQKLERLTLEEGEDAHPIPLKPSTLKPTPSSEGTDSGGVGDTTVSQHGLFHPLSSSCLPEVPSKSSPIVILSPLSTSFLIVSV